MELSFFINAVKRRPWIIILFIALGAAVGQLATPDAAPKYYSRAVLNVSPPSQSRVAVSFSSDPDRYVIGQLSVLNSAQLAERIATELGNGETTGSVQSAITIEHQPKTDIVLVTGTASSPERARDIADAYVTTYIEELRTQVDESQQPDIDQLNQDLQSTKDQITFIDAQIAAALAPYINEAPNVAVGYRPIPTAEQLVPELVTNKDALLRAYTRLSDTLKELELDAKLRVTSYVVQRATLPAFAETSSSKTLVAAGVLGGAALGLIATVIWARLSPIVLDERHAETILGRPVVGSFPRFRSLARNRRNALESLPRQAVRFVDELCVRAEANAEIGKALTVAVVGTERAAAATTIALAMAGRYGANGSSVVLIDADTRRPEISALYNARGGIPELLANVMAEAAGTAIRRGRFDPYTPTPVGEVSVLGLGDKSAAMSLRRQNVPALLDAASGDSNVHVVVIDGGPVLDAASTVQLCHLVDAVVLAVPLKHQRIEVLVTVAAQLENRRGELLPVITPHRRWWSLPHRSSSNSGAAMRVAGDPIIQTADESDDWNDDRNGTGTAASSSTAATTATARDTHVRSTRTTTSGLRHERQHGRQSTTAVDPVPRRPQQSALDSNRRQPQQGIVQPVHRQRRHQHAPDGPRRSATRPSRASARRLTLPSDSGHEPQLIDAGLDAGLDPDHDVDYDGDFGPGAWWPMPMPIPMSISMSTVETNGTGTHGDEVFSARRPRPTYD